MKKKAKTARFAIVGETLEVIGSSNPALCGLSGQVTDETKNTIDIMTPNGKKKIIKDQVTIRINNMTIDGKKLSGRVETRIKQ